MDVDVVEDSWISHGLLRTVSFDLLAVVDTSGRYTRVNAAWTTALGFSAEELLQMTFVELIHPEDVPRTMTKFQAVLAGTPAISFEARLRRKDGSYCWLSANAQVNHETNEVYSAARDISAQKERELRLARQLGETERARDLAESRYLDLFEQSPDMCVRASAPDGLIEMCNATLLEATGFSREALVGQPLAALYHSGSAGEVVRVMERFRDAGQVSNFEMELRCQDGSPLPVSLSMSGVREADGNVIGSISTWRDVTDVKRLESLEALTAELKRSNTELEHFAYAASHDLQEPLRMVSSFTTLLQQEYGGRLDEDADRYIHYAVDGAKRMQCLINDILAVSRVGTRGKPLRPMDASLALDEARFDLTQAIEESGAILDVGPLPAVRADATQLAQVFRNLIGNAVKFRGEVSPIVKIRAEEVGERWCFSVEDNGIGFDESHAPRVFLMFQRLMPRGQYEGSGVGLAIVKKIIERHGGQVWARSKPGEGTTMYFTLFDAGHSYSQDLQRTVDDG